MVNPRARGRVAAVIAWGVVSVGVLASAAVRAANGSVAGLIGAGQERLEQAVLTRAMPSDGTLPIVREHRYRMAAKIRPLMFWMGKDNVGGARVRWRQGEDGARGYDLLIGSDPRRAPRAINRWGFILEESRGGESVVLGVIKKSDQDTLQAAQADALRDGQQGHFWKMIQGRGSASESEATVTLTRVAKDYSYRDLDTLLDALIRFPGPPRVKKVAVPAGGRAGFLTALADLVHDTVESIRRDGRAPGRKVMPYAYYGYQYDLTRTLTVVRRGQTYGGRVYAKVADTDFEVRERGDTWVESFTLVVGLDGDLAEVPVFVSYQPKWWFKADMVLDDRESF
jgi:hypothetical protein